MNEDEVISPPVNKKYNLILRAIHSVMSIFKNVSFKSRCCYESECNNKSTEVI